MDSNPLAIKVGIQGRQLASTKFLTSAIDYANAQHSPIEKMVALRCIIVTQSRLSLSLVKPTTNLVAVWHSVISPV